MALYNAEGKVVLSGFLQNEENLLKSSDDLYNYIKEDTRFTYNDFNAPPSILNSSTSTEIINLSDYSMVNDIVKDVDFAAVWYIEEYVPISKDVIAFFVPSPSSTVYMVNLKTNEILFSQKFDDYGVSLSSEDGVCVILYYKPDMRTSSFDYLNDKGEIIRQITYVDYPNDKKSIDIPGTPYELIQEEIVPLAYKTYRQVL